MRKLIGLTIWLIGLSLIAFSVHQFFTDASKAVYELLAGCILASAGVDIIE